MFGRARENPVLAGPFGESPRSRKYPTKTAAVKRTTAPAWKGKAATAPPPPVVLEEVRDVVVVLDVATVPVELVLGTDELELE